VNFNRNLERLVTNQPNNKTKPNKTIHNPPLYNNNNNNNNTLKTKNKKKKHIYTQSISILK